MSPLIATGVNDTGGKFAASIVDTGANLPPVSTTLAELVAKLTAGVVDTGGTNLSLVVHLDLQKSPRIFEKIRNDPNVNFRGLGEGDS